MNQYQEVIKAIEEGVLKPFYQLTSSVHAYEGFQLKEEFKKEIREKIPKESFITGLKEVIKNVTWPFPSVIFTHPNRFHEVFKQVYDDNITTYLSDEEKIGLLTLNECETHLEKDILVKASDKVINQYLNHLSNNFKFRTYQEVKKFKDLKLKIKLTPEQKKNFIESDNQRYEWGYDALIDMGVKFTPEEIKYLQKKFEPVTSRIQTKRELIGSEFPPKLFELITGIKKEEMPAGY